MKDLVEIINLTIRNEFSTEHVVQSLKMIWDFPEPDGDPIGTLVVKVNNTSDFDTYNNFGSFSKRDAKKLRDSVISSIALIDKTMKAERIVIE